MKENINIEELFKQKFENFEGNVDPSIWANVSQSIGAGAASGASGAAGLSGLVKAAIIVGAAAVTTFSVWYFSTDTETDTLADNITNTVVDNDENSISTNENSTLDNNIEGNKNNENFSEGIISNDDQPETGNGSVGENGLPENGEQPIIQNEPINNVRTVIQPNPTITIPPIVEPPIIIPPIVQVESNPECRINGNVVTFISNAKKHTAVTWLLPDGDRLTGDEVTYDFKKPGSYKVTVIVDGEGTAQKATLTVEIKGTSSVSTMPNVISPNRDGKNDFLFIESEGIESFYIKIQDVDGKTVFESNNPNFEWNGELPDGSVEPGKYIYYFNAVGEDGQPYKKAGMFTIVL